MIDAEPQLDEGRSGVLVIRGGDVDGVVETAHGDQFSAQCCIASQIRSSRNIAPPVGRNGHPNRLIERTGGTNVRGSCAGCPHPVRADRPQGRRRRSQSGRTSPHSLA